jgi:hypothetical protein
VPPTSRPHFAAELKKWGRTSPEGDDPTVAGIAAAIATDCLLGGSRSGTAIALDSVLPEHGKLFTGDHL